MAHCFRVFFGSFSPWWCLLLPALYSCCGKRKPADPLSYPSWSYEPESSPTQSCLNENTSLYNSSGEMPVWLCRHLFILWKGIFSDQQSSACPHRASGHVLICTSHTTALVNGWFNLSAQLLSESQVFFPCTCFYIAFITTFCRTWCRNMHGKHST